MKHGALSKRLVRCMSAEILPMGIAESVLGNCLEDGLAVPRSDFPSRNISHELGFLISISSELLEEFAISLSHYQWIQSELARSHFDGISLHLIVI